MKIVVFGATGGTGKQLVQQALAQKHEVTAFVRNPAKLDIKHKNLRVFQGNILDKSDLLKAMMGKDAVLSTLGARSILKKTSVISEGAKNIIAAMKKHKVKRLIFESAFGVGESRSKAGLLGKVDNIVLKNIFADKVKQEEYIRKSGLDWVIVRPAILTNGPKKGTYRTGEDIKIRFFATISRADVSDFMLKQLSQDDYTRKTPTICY